MVSNYRFKQLFNFHILMLVKRLFEIKLSQVFLEMIAKYGLKTIYLQNFTLGIWANPV